MGADETTRSNAEPAVWYSERLIELKSAQAADQAQERRLGYAKVAVAFVTIAAAVLLLYYVKFLWLLVAPAAAFAFLAVLHEQRLQRIRQRQRSIEFYERGVRRIQDRWAGIGETGERFLDPAHPYARDLDLFGKASLFSFSARHVRGQARKSWRSGCWLLPRSKRSWPGTAPFTI